MKIGMKLTGKDWNIVTYEEEFSFDVIKGNGRGQFLFLWEGESAPDAEYDIILSPN